VATSNSSLKVPRLGQISGKNSQGARVRVKEGGKREKKLEALCKTNKRGKMVRQGGGATNWDQKRGQKTRDLWDPKRAGRNVET